MSEDSYNHSVIPLCYLAPFHTRPRSSYSIHDLHLYFVHLCTTCVSGTVVGYGISGHWPCLSLCLFLIGCMIRHLILYTTNWSLVYFRALFLGCTHSFICNVDLARSLWLESRQRGVTSSPHSVSCSILAVDVVAIYFAVYSFQASIRRLTTSALGPIWPLPLLFRGKSREQDKNCHEVSEQAKEPRKLEKKVVYVPPGEQGSKRAKALKPDVEESASFGHRQSRLVS